MWELIRANKRNSIILMVIMAACLLALGFVIGSAFFGPNAGFFGLIIASAIWMILTLISFSSGDQILLASSKATPVTHDVHPQLFRPGGVQGVFGINKRRNASFFLSTGHSMKSHSGLSGRFGTKELTNSASRYTLTAQCDIQ